MPLVSPFRTSFGTQTDPRRPAAARRHRRGRGLGRVRRDGRPALLLGVRRRAQPTCCAGSWCRRSPRPGRSTRTAWRTVARRRSRATGWPRPRWRWRVLDAELRAAGPLARPASSAPSATGCRAGSRSGSWTRSRRCSTPSAATSTRATSGSSSRSSPAGTSSRCARCASGSATTCCCRSTPTRRTRCADARHLARLDPFDLLLIEQPLDEEDVLGHADLAQPDQHADLPRRVDHLGAVRGRGDPARRLLRSSTSSPAGSAATSRRARIHDVCVAHGVPVWCGGMLETGLGRAANVALAALPGFTLPGDTSASGPLLPHGHHRRRSCSTTATCACRPGPGSASSRWPTSSPPSPPRSEWSAA